MHNGRVAVAASIIAGAALGVVGACTSPSSKNEEPAGNDGVLDSALPGDTARPVWDGAYPDGDWVNHCSNCVARNCPAEYDACTSNGYCGAVLGCVNICFTNAGDAAPSTSCIDACFAGWDGGKEMIDVAKACLASSCKAACGR